MQFPGALKSFLRYSTGGRNLKELPIGPANHFKIADRPIELENTQLHLDVAQDCSALLFLAKISVVNILMSCFTK